MSQYPPPPQPPQWGPPPPPPQQPPPRTGWWIGVACAVALLVIGVFAVTAFAAPGFLVDDDSDESSSESSDDKGSDAGPGGQPEIPIPPPNASDGGSTDEPPPDEPAPSEPPPAPTGDPSGFAEEFLTRVAAGDEAGVDEAMCLEDQEWQYEDAVADGRSLTLDDPHGDASAPDGIIGDLVGPEGDVDGRITVLPDDGGSWCIDTFYVF